MKEKALKYTIVLLLIPLIASLLIAILTNNVNDNVSDLTGDANTGEMPSFNKTRTEEIKSTNTYIYVSVFTLCIGAGVVLLYVKRKRDI